jgi:hypothetical protein
MSVTKVHESNKPQYTVQTTPQDIFVKFEIWVNPKDNYRELEKMLGRLLDAWVTDLKLKDLDTKLRPSKSPKSSTKGKGADTGGSI